MKLRSYFFALASATCMFVTNVFCVEQKIAIHFDDLYPQSSFKTSLNLSMRILGELKADELEKQPKNVAKVAALMRELSLEVLHISSEKVLPDDLAYLVRLIRVIEHAYKN